MATPFEDVYNRAIFKFADHKFLEQTFEVRESVLEQYLISAITDFQPHCLINLSDYNLAQAQFNVDLTDEVIEILATGIAYYWLSYKALDSDNLKNKLNSKDYYYYSPGNLLKEVHSLRDAIYNDFYSKIRKYSFVHGDFATLTV